MKNGILKRLKFLIDFGNFQKQNLQFDDRLKNAEEKMQSIQTESKARFQTSNEFHFRWLKMIHYRDRDESSNSHLDSVTKIPSIWRFKTIQRLFIARVLSKVLKEN